MASLAGEIAQLAELHKAGVLSDVEFTAAKEAAIKQFATSHMVGSTVSKQVAVLAPSPMDQDPPEAMQSTSAVSPPAVSSVGTVHLCALATCPLASRPLLCAVYAEELMEARQRFPHMDLEAWVAADGEVSGRRRQCALDHLERIFSNVLRYPGDTKYRQLRLQGQVLAQHVLSVPGCLSLLESVGFGQTTIWNDGRASDYLRLTQQPREQDRLEEALSVVAFLRQRDSDRLARLYQLERWRKGPSFAIRLDRGKQKVEEQDGALAYLTEEFTLDEAGDGLHSSLRNLLVLEQLIEEILHSDTAVPSSALTYRIPLAQATMHRAIVQQRGALGLLLLVAGAEWESAEGEQLEELYLVVTRQSNAPDPWQRLKDALHLTKEVVKTVQRVKNEREMAERVEAKKYMCNERQRELYRQQHNHEAENTRCQEEPTLRNVSRARTEEGEGAEEGSISPMHSQHRVPLSVALDMLMGRGGWCAKDGI